MPPTTRHILLADDNDANLLITRTILERAGYIVTTANNGSHALSLAKLTVYDLILLDIMMPVLDGVRALRRLRRQNGPNRKTPVFALTAYCSPEDQQRYLLAGFDSVLSKPLRPGDIEIALKRHVNNESVPAVNHVSLVSSDGIPLLDLDIIAQYSVVGNAEKLEEVQTRYWASTETQCKIIESILHDVLKGSADHLAQFRSAVHAVKGASATIGLARVERVCRRLQNAPRSEIPGLMLMFADALSQSRPQLLEALSGSGQFDPTMEMGGEHESEPSHDDQNHRAAI